MGGELPDLFTDFVSMSACLCAYKAASTDKVDGGMCSTPRDEFVQ